MKDECVYCLWYDEEKDACSHDEEAACLRNDPNYFESKDWEEELDFE